MHRPATVAGADVVEGVLQGSGAAGRRGRKVGVDRSITGGVLLRLRGPAAPLPLPEFQLRLRLQKPVQREGDCAYRQPF
ncbi:MAG TPA: hypothetical protein VFY42_02335, partial [Gemmatimonadales bacterium]|nr:hypothetical protein [Gemmatimonadales bacterium]